ncbi:MAG: heavy-metal-associated domain-containing protein [candidate division NC10 bacterium]|nr:heavy-metal-associated domain-containing protein [candidate division NC10 bacterium]
MKWVVVASIGVFVVLLFVRFLRNRVLGQATIHMAHMKSEAEALEVARILKGLQGMMEVSVDLERRRATVSYRKTKIAIEEIMRALHAAGF